MALSVRHYRAIRSCSGLSLVSFKSM
ncbi:hypothetical protein F383_35818 [Gossypium arboreum]|uniref:Uncharacterized protein n=1 Tax=Gossypium arboreum TaxID=29729 RepID=A0A0B0PX47_GOSAR|nr:hypothetical protein F383_35818 [Gossypium arboreum]